MINYFYSYIKNIILFLIFMSFIQVILPTNKYRSYINLVFGIILVLIMVKPLNIIFNDVKNIEISPAFLEETFNINSDINSEKYVSVQNDMIKNAFEHNIKRQIEAILKDKYYIKDININLYENKYKEMNIDKIELYIVKNDRAIYVKPFREDENISVKQQKEINDIKKSISDFYRIDINSIVITMT
ncbi:stage III sporulation protein AF [uncultured Tyzzerella sp.]|uniref:stage III sporulation protein AF n=1 Tax=uncultured Tyzzerella sp. TaxID=2321398 RepID=UPI0029434BF8|nr:stage III sporulation protein AF [uncultured Tyzzerella sp.]